MASKLEIRKYVKDYLNANIVDPFPSDMTRRGNQFFDEGDGFNFTRADTFPKGYITDSETQRESEKSPFSRSGWSKKFITFDVNYYVKEKQSFIVGSDTYRDQDLCYYMLEQIQNELTENPFIGSGYYMYPTSLGAIEKPEKISNGQISLWEGSIPISFYWMETYGI